MNPPSKPLVSRPSRSGESLAATVTVGPRPGPAAPVHLLAAGTRIADRYEILEVLGSGGSSVVYRAFDRDLQREVALKALRTDRFSEEALERLRREARVAFDASSPRLVRIFDISTGSETVYLTLELMPGGSLRRRLADGALPLDEVLEIARQIFEGLSVLHDLGIVHRDVKPANILLDGTGGIKLADFGLARRWDGTETRLTRTDSLVGTLAYLSPEQILGEGLGPHSDLYAAGLVLYEMLTGTLPGGEVTSLGNLLRQLRKPIPDPRRLRPQIPAWLARLVTRLLERQPERRHASARAVLGELRRRHSRRRLPRRGWLLAGLLLAVVVVGGYFRGFATPQEGFAEVSFTPRQDLRGISGTGKVLWQRTGLGTQFTTAVLEPDGPVRVVGTGTGRPRKRSEHRLLVLDAQTGETLEEIPLPIFEKPTELGNFADHYGTFLQVADLNADGVDEVLISLHHVPYWPSYTVLYEPRLHRIRLVFAASGHHTFAGAVDLDGDGRRELLFFGINNRTGWYQGLAAVRLEPLVDEPLNNARLASPFAYSPDSRRITSTSEPLLAWYALLPLGVQRRESQPLVIDEERREIQVFRSSGMFMTLDFGGFLAANKETQVSTERQRARGLAFEAVREAMRLRQLPEKRSALTAIREGVLLARSAGDAYLEEWARRVEGKILIAAGEASLAEALFTELAKSSEQAPEIAYDAGCAFHLQGKLDLAVAWYRRAYEHRGAALGVGRGKYEIFRNLVLALVELGRFDEAFAEVELYERLYPPPETLPGLRSFIQWRSGARPDLFENAEFSPDTFVYWRLEVRRARGEDPRLLLAEITSHRWMYRPFESMGLALEGQLLADLGRPEEALPRLETALARARQDALEDVEIRAHVGIIEERLSAIRRAVDSVSP